MDIVFLVNTAIQVYRYFPDKSNLWELDVRYLENEEDLYNYLENLEQGQFDFLATLTSGINCIMNDRQKKEKAIQLKALVAMAEEELYNTHL